ncbi:MAG: hypothetical protein GXP35_07450 [Actinobacteria bacterium]|nr:hypothetical protein [Actinomycetota bacterium]
MINADLPAPLLPTDPVTPEPTPGEPEDPPQTTTPGTVPPAADDITADDLLIAAVEAFDDADRALRLGDLAAYQAAVSRAEQFLQQAQLRLAEERLATEPDEEPTSTTATTTASA